MNYQEALNYLNDNLSKLKELNPTSIFIIAPFLFKDIEVFIKDVKEKGIDNVDVREYSSDGRFGVQAYDYRPL